MPSVMPILYVFYVSIYFIILKIPEDFLISVFYFSYSRTATRGRPFPSLKWTVLLVFTFSAVTSAAKVSLEEKDKNTGIFIHL